jgi:8-oxo-dGTP diphosphatase
MSVGVVVWRGDAVLLIRRGREPYKGMWSIPGGSVEFDERLQDAALRELAEETGVTAQLIGLIDVFESIEGERHYVMIDYAARWTSGEPRAGDDAAEAVFVSYEQACAMVSWDMTRDALARSRTLADRPNPAAKSS